MKLEVGGGGVEKKKKKKKKTQNRAKYKKIRMDPLIKLLRGDGTIMYK